MKRIRSFTQLIAWALLACLGFGCVTRSHADELATFSAHDPSRMVFDPVGNRWLIFYTGNGVPYATSPDQINWTHVNSNRVFPSSGTGADNTDYWAPDMWPTPIHGQYLLFYSLSSFGSQVSSIQVASTTSLTNPVWTKLGAAINSVSNCSGLNPGCNAPAPDYNTIDPGPFYDPVQDRLWITYGSFWDGIYIVELDPSNPTQQLSDPVWLAGGRPGLPYSPTSYPNAIEGSFVWFHGGYFYLNAATDVCCAGSASTYKIIIGRSTSITGPYVDKDGVDLRTYGGSIFAASAGLEIGPGQFGLYSLNGVDHYTYHIESYNLGRSTPLGERAIDYDPVTGWPLAVYPQTLPQGLYQIQRKSTSLYLHVRDESTNPTVEGHVEQDVLGSRPSQNWSLFPHTSPGGDTYYNIQNVGTKLWLEVCCDAGPGDNRAVPQAGTGSDFIRVDYANASSSDDQKWRVVLNTDGTYDLQSYRSGMQLGFPTSDTTPLLAAMEEPWILAQQPFASFALVDVTQNPWQLAFDPATLSNIHAGTNPGIVKVDVQNAAGALVPSAVNPVTLSITGPENFSQSETVASVAGVASFDLSALVLNVPGIYTLSATSTGLNGVTTSLAVNGTPMTVQLSSSAITYPASINVTIPVTGNGPTPTGTVQLFDGSTVIATLTLQGNGVAYWYIQPSLAVGVHQLTARYSGDSHYSQGLSPVATLTVSPAPVNLSVSCWNSSFPFGGNYTCTNNVSSSAGAPPGILNYSIDGVPSTATLNNGNAQFTVQTPNAGQHTVTIGFPAQGNFAASTTQTESFAVTAAPTQIQLSPSSYYQAAGTNLTLTVSLTSWSAGAPSDGTVTLYDGANLLGTSAISGGTAVFSTTGLAVGSHPLSAKYSGSTNFAAATSGTATIQIH